MNPADVIALVIVALLTIWGIKKGFVNSFFSLGSLVISLLLAMLISPLVSGFIESSFIGDAVYNSVNDVVSQKITSEFKAEELGEALPLPDMLKTSVTEAAEQTVEAAQKTITDGVTDIVLNLLSIVIVFILVKVIVWLLVHFFDLVSRLPVLRSANKLMGAIFGAAYGILIVYALLALLTFGVTVKFLEKPTELVCSSKIVSVMYNQNILLNFLQ